MDSCNLRSDILPPLATLSNLTDLDILSPGLPDEKPSLDVSWLSACPVQALRLEFDEPDPDVRFSPPVLGDLWKLRTLGLTLDLDHLCVLHSLPSACPALEQLELRLSRRDCEVVPPALLLVDALRSLRLLPQLRSLSTPFVGPPFEFISSITPQLTHLKLRTAPVVTRHDLAFLTSKLSALTHLAISDWPPPAGFAAGQHAEATSALRGAFSRLPRLTHFRCKNGLVLSSVLSHLHHISHWDEPPWAD